MRRWCLYIVVLFSLIGTVSSVIATQRYFEIQKSGFEEKSFCTINEFINCDAAYASPYAKLGNIPISGLGVAFYLGMAALTLFILIKAPQENAYAGFGWLLSLGGVGLSLYKAYVAFFVLHILCLVCLSIYIVNFVSFFSWHSFLKIGIKNWEALTLKQQFIPLSGATLLILGLGWGGTVAIQSKVAPIKSLGVSTEEVVQFHFSQQPYPLEILNAAPIWGNPNAKVTIIEFSDFECPFCKDLAFHVKPILNEFKNSVRFYFYHYPLDPKCNSIIQGKFHEWSCDAAMAATCAQKRGDFWSYHEDIFRKQKELEKSGMELLLALAKKRGWDENEFRQCMEDPATLKTVQEMVDAGQKLFISGTPTVFINNRKVKYWSDPEVFRAVLEEEIRRSK